MTIAGVIAIINSLKFNLTPPIIYLHILLVAELKIIPGIHISYKSYYQENIGIKKRCICTF